MFEPVIEVYNKYFFLEQVFYVCTLNKEDITLYLSSVEILQGTAESNLYKSIRVALITDDENVIIKHVDGNALPANSDDTTVDVDPAISTANITDSTLQIVLPGIEYNNVDGKNYVSPIKFTLRLWIEGQSPFAVAEYSGHAFKANLDFDVVK